MQDNIVVLSCFVWCDLKILWLLYFFQRIRCHIIKSERKREREREREEEKVCEKESEKNGKKEKEKSEKITYFTS